MAKDPYRYFRVEAQELLEALGRGVLELERARDADTVRRLLRHAHTLKGAARVVKQQEIADHAHAIEDLLAAGRDGHAEPDTIDRTLALLDSIRRRLALLDAPVDRRGARAESSGPEEQQRSIRVPIDELDSLLAGVMDAAAATAALRARLRREDLSLMDEITAELANLHERVFELRLVPASTIATDLERAVRDAAHELDKRVVFRATGTETRVDADVLFALRGALVHVVRNAVAHGIDRDGTVSLSIERRGHRVAFEVKDDGRGFDLAAIQRIAVERRLVSEQASRAMTMRHALDLLLRGGLSTSRTVTAVSGRGIGLDVVRETVERLKGELEVETAPGAGTTIAMVVPISLSSLPALSVKVGGSTALIPLDAVRRTVRLAPKDVSRTAEGERALVDGQVLPFLSLRRLLGQPRTTARADARTLVIVEAAGGRTAVEVDRVDAIQNVLVRSVPRHLAVHSLVAGAALDDQGAPRLLLAPLAMAQAALAATDEERSEDARQPEVLVIDDSLTTRMLEQSILESAGYRVDLAVSAEEGLEKARAKKYGLFLVDVEMPGMDGFEFIAHTRRDATLAETPAILVTSRNDPEDRRRGREAGARGYIVKSEFNQQQLLEMIQRLIG